MSTVEHRNAFAGACDTADRASDAYSELEILAANISITYSEMQVDYTEATNEILDADADEVLATNPKDSGELTQANTEYQNDFNKQQSGMSQLTSQMNRTNGMVSTYSSMLSQLISGFNTFISTYASCANALM